MLPNQKQMIIVTVLAAAVVTSQLVASGQLITRSQSKSQVPSGPENDWARLDAYLAERVRTIDLQANIDAANELLREADKPLKLVIKEFSSLQCVAKDLCSKRSSELSMQVFHSASATKSDGKNAIVYGWPKNLKRLSKILTTFFKERALDCLKGYADEWKTNLDKGLKFDKYTARLRNYTENFVDHLKCLYLEPKVADSNVADVDCLVQRFHAPLNWYEILKPIVAMIYEQKPAELRDILANGRKIGSELDELILEPCKKFLSERKHSISVLESTFYTFETTELTSNLFRVAMGLDQNYFQLFDSLIEWTSVFGACEKIQTKSRKALINELFEEAQKPDGIQRLLSESSK